MTDAEYERRKRDAFDMGIPDVRLSFNSPDDYRAAMVGIFAPPCVVARCDLFLTIMHYDDRGVKRPALVRVECN